jgi:histidinol phosphatase-like PHP family hydrolase
MKYFNIKTIQGVETVDHIERKDFATYKEYIIELKRLKKEYYLCGMNVYISQRADNYYNN